MDVKPSYICIIKITRRTIEITDNAAGMSIDQLQNAVRAGYTSNDPIGNLGLFGMGFNIATSRLGKETTVLSTRMGDTEWVGVKIDFQKLIDAKKYDAPIIHRENADPDECGTQITISKLKSGILSDLSNKESEIRQRLELVYAPLLREPLIKSQERPARNFVPNRGLEIAGILCVFQDFQTDKLGRKTR